MYAAIETEGRPPEAVLREMIGRLVDALATPRSVSLLRIMQRTAAHNDPADPRDQSALEAARCRIKEQAQRMGGMFKRYIEEQIAAGTLRPVDPSLATQLCVSAVLGTIMRRASGDAELARISPAQIVDAIVDVLVRGLLPRAHEPAAPTGTVRKTTHKTVKMQRIAAVKQVKMAPSG